MRWLHKQLFGTPQRSGAFTVVAATIAFAAAALGTHFVISQPEAGHVDTKLDGVTQPTVAAQPTAPSTSTATSASKRSLEGPCWSTYARSANRLSDAADLGHGPPIKKLWTMHVGLMEFPPAFCDGTLYVNNQRGVTFAVNATNKHLVWKRTTGTTYDSTPAVTATRVIVASYLPGTVKALDRATGKVLWALETGAGIEASPVVLDGIVYVTSRDRRMYAIYEATGRVKWAFRASSEIKDSPSVANGLVYFADYAAEVYALDMQTGKIRWRRTFGGVLGDRIYSSVPVRGSTVWFATVRGNIYALNARSGATRWHSSIAGYVYSTPAVSGNELFIGNYPGKLYAFDARSGRELWNRRVGGSISGSPTVIGSLVYVSSLSATRTVAFDTRTGKQRWSNSTGRYVSGIATDRALYLSLGSELSRWSTERSRVVVGGSGSG